MATAVFSPYKANDDNVAYSRDASFSSYLDTAEREFVRKLAESVYSPSPAREVCTPRVSIGRKSRALRSELDVFGADRYFNSKLGNKKSPIPRAEKKDAFLERKSVKSCTSNARSPTLSLKSEGSWNSQIGLRFFFGFRYKGSCFDKKSVYTTTTTHQRVQCPNKYKGNEHRRNKISHQDHFAFPIIDTASHHHDLVKHPRKSLDVFGFQQLGKQDVAKNLERKLSILAWDAVPNSPNYPPLFFPFPNTKQTNPNHDDDDDDDDQDMKSDTSSDLFEIEDISGIKTSPMIHCYAPSETSIDWSVVTASAADFSTVTDDDHEKFNEKIMIPTGENSRKNASERSNKVPRSSSSNGLLLGCRNHKAVDVVGNNTNHNNQGGYKQWDNRKKL